MLRLRLFRPVLTLALVVVLSNGVPPAAGRGAAGHGGAVPLRSTLPDAPAAPIAPFTPPPLA